MRSSVLAALVLAAACGSRSTAPVGNRGTSTPAGDAPAVTATTDGEGDFALQFHATGLPAVTDDGKSVALAHQGEDGARGAPNLTVIEKDRADKVVRELVVQTADGGEALLDDAAPAPPTERLAEANRYLTETHARRRLFPLTAMTLDRSREADFGHGSTLAASGDGVDVAWDEGQLKVTAGGRVVVDLATQGWTVEPTTSDGIECSNPSFLGEAWVDAARKLVVVRIAYTGNDTCWEPDSQLHVVAW